jgi:hypothetical protein
MTQEERELLIAIGGAIMANMLLVEADERAEPHVRILSKHHAKILATAIESVRNAEPVLTVVLRGDGGIAPVADIEHKGKVT